MQQQAVCLCILRFKTKYLSKIACLRFTMLKFINVDLRRSILVKTLVITLFLSVYIRFFYTIP